LQLALLADLQANLLLLLCPRLVGYERLQFVMRDLFIYWYLSFMFFGCFNWLEMLVLFDALSPLETLVCSQVYLHYEDLFVTSVCSRGLVTSWYSLILC
jgi:hypothetical protein